MSQVCSTIAFDKTLPIFLLGRLYFFKAQRNVSSAQKQRVKNSDARIKAFFAAIQKGRN